MPSESMDYPLLGCGTEGYMFKVLDSNELTGDLEAIDVEDNEYRMWDCKGFPVTLFLENGFVKGRYAAQEDQSDKVIAAIKYYALTFGHVNPPDESSFYKDLPSAFDWADEQVEHWRKEHRILTRIRRALKRLFSNVPVLD